MTVKSLIKTSLLVSVLCSSFCAYAADEILKTPFSIQVDETNKETVTAVTLDDSPIELQQKNFSFDWNQQATIAANQTKVADEEKFIATITDVSKLNKEDQRALGLLFYKLGTYYVHVAREPNPAITKLSVANALLTDKQEKAWVYNQLAYAYAERFAATEKSDDKEKALYYLNKVTVEFYPHTKNQTVAFAYSIKGLVQFDEKDYSQAEKTLRMALAMYESLPDGKDEQYIRTKSRLANALLGQEGHDREAITLLKQVKQYWSAQGNLNASPYAARSLVYLGQAYLKIGKTKQAKNELKMAINIYKNVYGDKSALLVKLYQLLAQANTTKSA